MFRWTSSALGDGAYDNAVVGFLGLLFLLSALFLTIGAAAPIMPPVVTSGESGAAFSPNRAVRIAGALAGVSVLLWGSAAGLVKTLGRLRVAGDSYVITALPLIGLACAAVLGWMLLKRKVFRGKDRLTVTLTPEGIAGLNHSSADTVAWAEITDVSEENGIVAGMPVGLTHLVIRTDGSVFSVYQSQFLGGPLFADAVRACWRDHDRV